ncbi:interleukin-8-like, partial [Acipenser oxyrinchus oxyrinchus]
ILYTNISFFFPAAPLRLELVCKCVETVSDFISPKQIANLNITPEGPHCSNMEVIATLKNGNEICLNPETKWVKAVISRLLHRYVFPVVLYLYSRNNSSVSLNIGYCVFQVECEILLYYSNVLCMII